MRDIGRKIRSEQNLSTAEINWLVIIANAILRAFTLSDGRPMRHLSDELDVSPTTFYKVLRLSIEALTWIYRTKKSIQSLMIDLKQQADQIHTLKQSLSNSKKQVNSLTSKLFELNAQVSMQESEINRLNEQWKLGTDRLIVVLKMSGRCTVRSIVEVLEYGLGLSVSVGYVQKIITQAGENSESAFQKLLQVIPLSGAICIDEIYLKEAGQRIWGIVIVDPMSGLILCLERAHERSSDEIARTINKLKAARPTIEGLIKLCLTDMYKAYAGTVKELLPLAKHQYCWFHINCFHIGATVKKAERAYYRAVKQLEAFDKKVKNKSLTAQQEQERAVLEEACKKAQKEWLGSQRFQKMLMKTLKAHSSQYAQKTLDRLIASGNRISNPYVKHMAKFFKNHREQLLSYYACLENNQHVIQRLSHSKQKWVNVTKLWAIPITTNAAEHAFRQLRRYTKNMEQFGTEKGTRSFFNLFVLYHNCRTLREGKKAGNTLLEAAHVSLVDLFGSDDPYTILGFPKAEASFTKRSVSNSKNRDPKNKTNFNILKFSTDRTKSVHRIAA